jgi:hypothetical protein
MPKKVGLSAHYKEKTPNNTGLVVEFGSFLLKQNGLTEDLDNGNITDDWRKSYRFLKRSVDWDKYNPRNNFVKFGKENGIKFRRCILGVHVPLGMFEGGAVSSRSFHLDVPYDELNVQYQLLLSYLENQDGTPKIEEIDFLCLDRRDIW